MITILRWINWTIAALPWCIRSLSRRTHLLAHSHLLSVRKLTLQLALLLSVPSLTRPFICRRCAYSNKVGRFWSDHLAAGVLNSTLDILLIDVWSRIHRALNVGRLSQHAFARSTTLACSHWRHSESAGLWDVEALADVLSWLHRTALRHLLEGVIATVSLTLRLVRPRAKTTCGTLHVLLLRVRWGALGLRIKRNVGRGDVFSIRILLNIVYLDVIEAIVEITDI